MTNREKYKKAFDVLAASEKISLEVDQMKNKKQKSNYKRSIVAAIAVLVVVTAAGSGVYAAAKYWGILDFADRTAMDVPEEAVPQIQTKIETAQETNDTIFQCTVEEALCDSQTITVVYEVAAKEAGKYLFVPEDALPEDLMSNWSNVSDMTAQEYAAQKGLTIVNIGGGIRNTDELGIVEQSIDFLSVSDDVMDICVTCGKAEEGTSMDVTMLATAHVSGSEEVMRLQSDFVLQDMSTTTMTTYLCREQAPGEQFFEIEKADVIQTELGTYVDIYYSNTKGDDPEDGLAFRIVDQTGKAYESTGGSGVICVENGLYRQRCMLNKCEIGETLYVEAFDCWGKEVYGVTELSRE
ncbi:MAG: hypothetical protein J6C00_12600 [Eubacterium sp.]|nr:hypothetical protein [Eubacterium sp.]